VVDVQAWLVGQGAGEPPELQVGASTVPPQVPAGFSMSFVQDALPQEVPVLTAQVPLPTDVLP
jgi:hypothetical protein